jgi:hypothetical protein
VSDSPSPAGVPPYSQINFLKPIAFSDAEEAVNGAIQASKK